MLVQFNQKIKFMLKKIKEFITHGTSNNKWKKLFFDTLDNKKIEFIKLLSIMMPKVKLEDDNNDK